MAKQASRVQTKNRPITLEARSELLIHAMNDDLIGAFKGNRTMLDPRALLLVVKRFQALDNLLGDRSIALFSRGKQGEIIDSQAVLQGFGTVNRLLRRYTATPSISPTYYSDGDPSSRGWWLKWEPAGGRMRTHFELSFVLQILDIVRAGRISYLKQCANCHRWLFARFAHQRFCKEGCKEIFHRSDATDKQRRREWARKNYWLHKHKNTK